MSAPSSPSLAVRRLDRAALAAGAAPGVADPVQPIAAEPGVTLAKPHWPHDDTVRLPKRHCYTTGLGAIGGWYGLQRHRRQYPAQAVTRQCVGCGVVRECDPSLPCADCGASPFHLIPLRP